MKHKETNMLTVRDVAERLDANPGTVRMWCINKTFPNAVQEETLRGPIWLIPESDLAGFEKRGPGRPPKAAPASESRATAKASAGNRASSKQRGRKTAR
jgi:hypothetical protein